MKEIEVEKETAEKEEGKEPTRALMICLKGVHTPFKELAERRGLSMAEIIRSLIAEEIRRDEDRLLDRQYKQSVIRSHEKR